MASKKKAGRKPMSGRKTTARAKTTRATGKKATGKKKTARASTKASGVTLRGVAPSLTVNALDKSLAWYRDVLGCVVKGALGARGALAGVELGAGPRRLHARARTTGRRGATARRARASASTATPRQDIDRLAAADQGARRSAGSGAARPAVGRARLRGRGPGRLQDHDLQAALKAAVSGGLARLVLAKSVLSFVGPISGRGAFPMPTPFVATSVLLVVGSAAVAGAAGATYPVVESKSSVRIHVGKSGAFSFAGHRHEVQAPVSGTVTADPANLSASTVDLTFASGHLRVLPDGEPSGDAPKVEEVMHGPEVLDAVRFPEIHFLSKKVTGQRSRAAATS